MSAMIPILTMFALLLSAGIATVAYLAIVDDFLGTSDTRRTRRTRRIRAWYE